MMIVSILFLAALSFAVPSLVMASKSNAFVKETCTLTSCTSDEHSSKIFLHCSAIGETFSFSKPPEWCKEHQLGQMVTLYSNTKETIWPSEKANYTQGAIALGVLAILSFVIANILAVYFDDKLVYSDEAWPLLDVPGEQE